MNDGGHQTSPPSELARITCDRFCRACTANLVGCPVEREAKYGLLVAKCPACGALNPVDSFPRAGAWAERWTLLLAALWLFLLPVIAVGTDLAIISGTYGIAWEASWPVRNAIDAEFMEWAAQRHSGDPNAVYANYWEEYAAFFDDVGVAGVRERIGGFWSNMNVGALLMAVIPFLGSALMGCFWAITLLGASWRARLAACAIHFSVVAVIALVVTWIMDARPSQFDVYSLVSLNITNIIWAALLVFMLAAMLAGAMWGRKLARLVIGALLPPRLASSFRILWDVDRQPPPGRAGRVPPRSGAV